MRNRVRPVVSLRTILNALSLKSCRLRKQHHSSSSINAEAELSRKDLENPNAQRHFLHEQSESLGPKVEGFAGKSRHPPQRRRVAARMHYLAFLLSDTSLSVRLYFATLFGPRGRICVTLRKSWRTLSCYYLKQLQLARYDLVFERSPIYPP
jgi:hypothetical protein